ncbi:MAG: hypothetical protein COB66_03240 [Coxiella sp. (in: Bacteria)]|nr:MAG: hypothetical protein COB66_03240 [Coxiella sp. (in: g-proteobacteria)]
MSRCPSSEDGGGDTDKLPSTDAEPVNTDVQRVIALQAKYMRETPAHIWFRPDIIRERLDRELHQHLLGADATIQTVIDLIRQGADVGKINFMQLAVTQGRPVLLAFGFAQGLDLDEDCVSAYINAVLEQFPAITMHQPKQSLANVFRPKQSLAEEVYRPIYDGILLMLMNNVKISARALERCRDIINIRNKRHKIDLRDAPAIFTPLLDAVFDYYSSHAALCNGPELRAILKFILQHATTTRRANQCDDQLYELVSDELLEQFLAQRRSTTSSKYIAALCAAFNESTLDKIVPSYTSSDCKSLNRCSSYLRKGQISFLWTHVTGDLSMNDLTVAARHSLLAAAAVCSYFTPVAQFASAPWFNLRTVFDYYRCACDRISSDYKLRTLEEFAATCPQLQAAFEKEAAKQSASIADDEVTEPYTHGEGESASGTACAEGGLYAPRAKKEPVRLTELSKKEKNRLNAHRERHDDELFRL